ncbi:MAG: trehalose-phosphatase [Candidatus Eisenbacteria sp.]|nr:trehalose-phosphatase [Candidatus Eisenbacteria bacterium]
MSDSSRRKPRPSSNPVSERLVAELPPALEHVPAILARLDLRPAVFLDFDGTLAPIVSRPEDACLPAESREQLRRLAEHVPVGILSGRELADVRRRVGLETLQYAGSHGFEFAAADGVCHDHPEATAYLPLLDAAEQELRRCLAPLQGVIIERKRFSLAVHVRLAGSEETAAAARAVVQVLDRHRGLRCTRGRKVYDLQPGIDWHKGRALLRMLAQINAGGGSPRRALYIGDDVTDEDAFRILAGRGVAVVVRDGLLHTTAEYVLGDPREVCLFLATFNHLLAQAGNRMR